MAKFEEQFFQQAGVDLAKMTVMLSAFKQKQRGLLSFFATLHDHYSFLGAQGIVVGKDLENRLNAIDEIKKLITEIIPRADVAFGAAKRPPKLEEIKKLFEDINLINEKIREIAEQARFDDVLAEQMRKTEEEIGDRLDDLIKVQEEMAQDFQAGGERRRGILERVRGMATVRGLGVDFLRQLQFAVLGPFAPIAEFAERAIGEFVGRRRERRREMAAPPLRAAAERELGVPGAGVPGAGVPGAGVPGAGVSAMEAVGTVPTRGQVAPARVRRMTKKERKVVGEGYETGLFLFFNKRAYKARYTREVLRHLKGEVPGTGIGGALIGGALGAKLVAAIGAVKATAIAAAVGVTKIGGALGAKLVAAIGALKVSKIAGYIGLKVIATAMGTKIVGAVGALKVGGIAGLVSGKKIALAIGALILGVIKSPLLLAGGVVVGIGTWITRRLGLIGGERGSQPETPAGAGWWERITGGIGRLFGREEGLPETPVAPSQPAPVEGYPRQVSPAVMSGGGAIVSGISNELLEYCRRQTEMVNNLLETEQKQYEILQKMEERGRGEQGAAPLLEGIVPGDDPVLNVINSGQVQQALQ